jgi:5-methyltetrahydrofolate--homocysteine methyltransferase
MKEPILSVLARGDNLVGDGAMGTMLQAAGLPAGMMPEAWNADNPEAVRQVHRAYLAAGAQIITTNTFGGSRLRLAEAGLAERTVELNRLGAALAREIAGDQAWVAGSVGPTGQIMEPYGDLAADTAEEVFAEQIRALAEGGADLIKIETQHDIEEACAAIRATRAVTTLPILCSFTFNTKGRTMMGLRAADGALRAAEAGAEIVGANCGDGPEAVRVALEAMHAAVDLPLLAQANAGIPQSEGGVTIWDVTPEQMAAHAREFLAAGARIVGGCCGTNPEFIAAIGVVVRS